MSISTELTRMAGNVGALAADTNAIFEALRAKGVDVPPGATLGNVVDMIGEIELYPTYVTIGTRAYKTVTIGNQEWMAENLDYKFSYNGSTIPVGGSSAPSTPAAWYYDNDDTSYGIDGTYKCGLLYNQYAAKYLDDNKDTLLPNGWHVPNNDELNELGQAVGGLAVASTKLNLANKSITTTWPSDWNGTNDYGFNGIPSGGRYDTFRYLGGVGGFWSVTQYSNDTGYYIHLKPSADASIDIFYKVSGMSIRLVRTIS
jgi:uncharacterized protein (TIGR02145 family)